jgi:hypothetical protein
MRKEKTKVKPTKPLSKNSKVAPARKGGAMTRTKFTAPVQVKAPLDMPEGANTFDGLIRDAIKDRAPMEYVQAMIAERNKEIARLASIEFNKAHREFLKLVPAIVKNKHVEFKHKAKENAPVNQEPGKTDYWYSELAHVIETVKDAEHACGFSHDWRTSYDGNKIRITCIMKHIGGHQQTDTMESSADPSGSKSAIQANASAISYLRRYSFMGVFGLSARGDDNDARKVKGDHVEDYQGKDQWGMLETPTLEQFNEAVAKVAAGECTPHDIQLIYRLTPEQDETLMHAAK